MDATNKRQSESNFLHFVQRATVGVTTGLATAQMLTTWATVCGVSVPSLVILCTAIVAGLRLASLGSLGRGSAQASGSRFFLLTSLLLSTSWLLPQTLNFLLTSGVHWFPSSVWLNFGIPGIPVFLLTVTLRLWLTAATPASNPRAHSLLADAALVIGICGGLILPVLQGLVIYPAAVPVTIAIAIVGAIRFMFSSADTVESSSAPAPPASETLIQRITVIGTSVGLGGFLVAGARLATVLMPLNFPLLLTAAAVTIAISAGCLSCLTRWPRRGPAVAAALSLLTILLVPICRDRLVHIHLSLNASVSSEYLLMLLRSAQLAVFWLPAVVVAAAGRLLIQQDQNSSEPDKHSAVELFRLLTPSNVVLGAALVLAAHGTVPTALLPLSLMLLCLPIARAVTIALRTRLQSQTDSIRSGRVAIYASAAVGCLCVVATWLVPMQSPDAVRLLFSSRSAQAYRTGMSPDVIAQSTNVRMVDEWHSAAGHLTAWRTAGDQVRLRRDAIPVGQITTNSVTTPQPVTDTLPVILPLIMHPNAGSVLLLGDETGAGLKVCSGFPLHRVVACRPDAAATEFAERYTWSTLPQPPAEDDRFEFETAPVASMIRRKRSTVDRFDVVIAVSPNPSTMAALEQLTPDFYCAIRNQLTDEGVFCQRITRHDLGATPLFRIVSSVSEVFDRVVMIHLAAGEVAIVAGAKPDSLLDDRLLDRMQRDHVVRALSHSGWDWSQVAVLPAIDTNDPIGIFEHREQATPASAANSHFAFALPLEALSWTDKAAELRNQFAPHQQRVADAAERGDAYAEFGRRFSAVVQQSEILTAFPDQPWPYRRSLRTEMQRNPRPPVETIRNGKVVRTPDPRDELRKDYFVTLGSVLQQAKTGVVDPLSLRELARFTTVYEPLVSLFAHHELIRIHEATNHPSPARELQHRLHTIYFTDGGDFSVRQITDTLKQILEDPQLIASDADRFDHVNSMLQELVRRWEARRGYEPPSARRTQQDVESCIAVAGQALEKLQDWSRAVDMDSQDLLARRRFINKALIAPLRNYQEQVLAHRIRNEPPLPMNSFDESGDLPMLIDPAEVLTTN